MLLAQAALHAVRRRDDAGLLEGRTGAAQRRDAARRHVEKAKATRADEVLPPRGCVAVAVRGGEGRARGALVSMRMCAQRELVIGDRRGSRGRIDRSRCVECVARSCLDSSATAFARSRGVRS